MSRLVKRWSETAVTVLATIVMAAVFLQAPPVHAQTELTRKVVQRAAVLAASRSAYRGGNAAGL